MGSRFDAETAMCRRLNELMAQRLAGRLFVMVGRILILARPGGFTPAVLEVIGDELLKLKAMKQETSREGAEGIFKSRGWAFRRRKK